MVELANVSFAYETDVQATHVAVRDINLSVGVGECVLLCGPSGGGKSTVLKLVNEVIPHFSSGNVQGSIRIAGRDVSNMPLYERSLLVANVFQNPKSQFFNTDVESEIAFALENQGLAAEEITCRLARTIEELHLEDLCERSMFALSGGQKQRVAFASAAIAQTPVVVLDEPSANLDNASIELIAGAIRLLKTRGVSVLIAEHRLNYLQGIVDTAYFVEEGTITRRFTGDELYGLSDAERRSLGLRSLIPDHGLPACGIGGTGGPGKSGGPDISGAADGPSVSGASGASGVSSGPGGSGGSHDAMLSICDLELSHKRLVVQRNLSIDIFPGEIVGLAGENGAGKTTLLRTIAGLAKQRRGNVVLNGKLTGRKHRRQSFGMVMQDVNHQLFSDSAAGECLLGNPHLTRSDAIELLESVDLSGLADRHPMSLSGGQKQRLAIAVAAAANKRVLLLDEPTSGLDYRNMIAVGTVLRQLANRGIPVVVATHDRELIESVCTRTETLRVFD